MTDERLRQHEINPTLTEANSMDSSSAAYQAVEALADEFMERQRRGEQPTLDEYVERHPDLADEIREVFPALAVIEQIAPASDDLKQSQQDHESPAQVRVSQIGDYRILREVGRGGMGVVYEAEQQSLRRRVALKVLPRQFAGDQKALERFQREARAAARMHHTNIVPVFEVGDDDEHVFYAMQLIQGQGLDVVIDDLQRLRSERSGAPVPGERREDQSHRLSIAASLALGSFERQDLVAEAQQQENAPAVEYNATVIAETALFDTGSTASAVLPGQSEMSTAETDRDRYYRSVAQIGQQTAGALAYAHARGIIHRDIKPSNLLLDTAGVVWITDFGLAKTGDEALTHTGDILGTIRYMSPERFQGQCDVRADVYSLGLTLYELLVLTPAFSSPDRLKLIEMVSKSEPPTPRSIDPRIPRDLETIVLKSIDKDPRRRYPTAEDLADDLERFIQDEPILARRISTPERFVRWSRRNRGLAVSISAAALLLVVIAIGSVLAAGYYRHAEHRSSEDAQVLTEQRASLEQVNSDLENANAAIAREAENAREQERAATEARDDALTARDQLRRELYVADLQEVRQAYLEGAANRVGELLTKYVPREGESDLRGWEWYYWWRAAHSYTQGFDASPKTGSPIDYRPLKDLVVAPDMSWIALHRWPGDVVVLDAQTMQQRAVFNVGPSPDYSHPLAVSPDGRYLATIGAWQVKLWRTADWSETAFLPQTAQPFAVAISSRDLLAVGDLQGRVRFWNVQDTSAEVGAVEAGDTVGCLEFSPDGNGLAIGILNSADSSGTLSVGNNPFGALHIWDVDTRTLQTQLVQSSKHVLSLAWTEHDEGGVLAAGFGDGQVRLWDAETWGERDWLAVGQPVLALDFSPGGEQLAAATGRDNTIHVWETASVRQVASWKGHARNVWGVGFADGGETVWSASSDGTLKAWAVSQNGAFDRLRGADSNVETPHSASLVFGSGSQTLWRHEPSGAVHRWNLRTGESQLVFPETESDVRPSQFPNGLFLVTCRQENGVENRFQVWRTDEDEPVLLRDRSIPMADSGGIPRELTVSGDGSAIAWSSGVNLFRLDFSSGHLTAWTESAPVVGLGLSVDGQGLGVVRRTHDWDLRNWDVSVDPPRLVSTLPEPGPVYDFNESPDGSYIAVGRWQNRVDLFDPASGEVLGYLHGHSGAVMTVDFSPDGQRLASGGADGTVRLWDLEQRTLLATFPAHRSDVVSVVFSPDGQTIASLSREGETRLWHGGTEAGMQDPRYWTWLAEIHQDNQSLASALSAWNEAIRLAPEDAELYLRRVDLFLSREQFSEAEADLEMAMSVGGPVERRELLRRKYRLHLHHERWHDAALDFGNLTTLDAGSSSVEWMRAAALHAAAVIEGNGQIDDYRLFCDAMIERFRDPEQPNPIEHTIISCGLFPTDARLDQLHVERLHDALSAGTVAEWVTWFENACALHAYRAGDFATAGEMAEDAFESASRTWEHVRDEARAMAMAVGSLVHSAMGRTDEAEAALSRARELNTARMQRRPDGSIVGSSVINQNGTIFHNPLINEVLIREAESAIDR